MIDGKRLFVVRQGEPVEVEDAYVATWRDYNGAKTLYLDGPSSSGGYYVDAVEEQDDRIVVRLDRPVGWTGSDPFAHV